MTTKRAKILDEAARLIAADGERGTAYGSPTENFGRIAAGWSVILDKQISAEQTALCMAWLKIARLVHSSKEDGYVDGAAYIALAAELADE